MEKMEKATQHTPRYYASPAQKICNLLGEAFQLLRGLEEPMQLLVGLQIQATAFDFTIIVKIGEKYGGCSVAHKEYTLDSVVETIYSQLLVLRMSVL